MVRILKNKMSITKSMSRIVFAFGLLVNCGCAVLKMPEVEYSSFSVTTECGLEWVRFSLSVDDNRVLRCECDGNGVELNGFYVRLLDLEKDEYSIPDDGKVRLEDGVYSALYNPETRNLWTSRVRMTDFPYYATVCREGGASGGYMDSERHFDKQVQLPDNLSDYPCVECEAWIQVHGVGKTIYAYLFRQGIDMMGVKNVRRLYRIEDESGVVWHLPTD